MSSATSNEASNTASPVTRDPSKEAITTPTNNPTCPYDTVTQEVPSDPNTPVPGLSLDGKRNYSMAEIFALPQDERDTLARCMGVVSWEPLTFKLAISTPANAGPVLTAEERERYKREMERAATMVLPNEDDDEL